jgi:hypothetical protein
MGITVPDDALEQVVESFLARFRTGERPSIEEYAARYPDLADQVRDLLPALAMVEQDLSLGGQTDATSANGEGAAGVMLRHLGDYLIVREIGRGGMGVVYEAVQQSLGRHVALKVLLWSSLSSTVTQSSSVGSAPTERPSSLAAPTARRDSGIQRPADPSALPCNIKAPTRPRARCLAPTARQWRLASTARRYCLDRKTAIER